MRIAHVYDGHERVFEGRGSVPDVVWQIAHRTAARGHDVSIIERQWQGLPAEAEHEGVSFRRLNLATGSDKPWDQIPYKMVSSPRGALTLLADRCNFARLARRVVKDLNPDVLHVHLPFAATILATFSPGARGRMVYTAHLGETEKRVRDPRFSPDVFLAKRTAAAVVLNPTMKEAFVERGVPPDDLRVIPNGVDTAQFDDVSADDPERIRAEYGLPADSVLILFVGTVTPRKGVRELVQAVSRMDADRVHFIVVGRTDLDAEYVAEIKEALEADSISDRVSLIGFVPEDDLHALYALADAFTLPSFEEGSSISVMEAIAAGLPVIGSRIDGIVQQVEDGVHGYLVEPGDIEGLAAAYDRIVQNASTRAEMTAAVTERSEELSWERVVDRTIEVYRQVATR